MRSKRLLQKTVRALGRKNVYRLGRFLSMEARLDVHNDPRYNGEQQVQRFVVEQFFSPVVFDVGANVGEWTESQLRCGAVKIHAFEPCAATFDLLRRRVGSRARLVQAACSSVTGRATLHVMGDGAGTNTIAEPIDPERYSRSECVRVITIADYCAQEEISHIELLKIDAEGFDYEVMAGAEPAMSSIAMIQFEYNQRWIGQRRFLRDAFHLLQPKGYMVGKITPQGVEFYPRWNWELETFREGNYLACRSDIASRLPHIVPAWLSD